MDWSGKVCVITGASSGIGRRLALDLAARGAHVCVAARREDLLRDLVAEMRGSRHSYQVTDVSDRAQIAALAEHVKRTYGRCDVLVNNAGFSNEREWGSDDAVSALEEVMRVNFFGVVWCTDAFTPLLEASAPSHVVNVASVAGRLAAGAPAYSASKFAVVGWSEALHFQLAPRGIFVSLVEPGIVPTEGFPADEITRSRILRFTTGTVEQVSAAVQDAVEYRKLQRVVPRWYYLLQVPRLLFPPLYRWVQVKIVTPIYRRNARVQTKDRSSGVPRP